MYNCKGKVMFDFDKYPRISVDGEGEARLGKLCSAIVKHYNASIGREELHVALLGLVDFCNLHNDGGRLTNFLNALPMNAPKRAIVLWLSAMTSWKLAENKNKQVIFKSLDDEGKTCTPYVMLEAAATPFYNYEPAKADATPKPFDFSGKVTDLIATGMKRLKAGKIDDPVEALLIRALHDEMPAIILAMKAKAKADAAPAAPAAPVEPAANNVVALDAPAQAAA